MQKRSKISIFIFLFLAISIFYPLLVMLLNVKWDTFGDLLSSIAFKTAFSNSLVVTTTATIISVGIAYLLAYTLNRTTLNIMQF